MLFYVLKINRVYIVKFQVFICLLALFAYANAGFLKFGGSGGGSSGGGGSSINLGSLLQSKLGGFGGGGGGSSGGESVVKVISKLFLFLFSFQSAIE